MSLRKYLTSKVFFVQIWSAIGIFAVIGFLFMYWLEYATKHGEVVVVPNLSKLSEEQVEEKLDRLNLEYVLLDTMDYNPDYPKLSVLEQDPVAGMQVKEGRKVYIRINDNGYTMVRIPNLIQQTYRQAVPTLRAMGLSEGTKTYVPDIGKDMVLEMRLNGKVLRPGDKVLKSSKIDLFVGDGKSLFDESELDSTKVETTEKPADEQ
ncbi:PASTA domain-containing protein [Flavobacterium branchiophilum NBRC 15030 = ATCC 35035]|uniref:PASTA domain-containing protein n=2 Tax=Flavobacterium branchiophilum TaxID=55197 RepID=A0A2H3KSE1_9FLAO|nr:PASTA domain-containing protein [Flavobacterium branchiophilum]OXA76895.1 PASTA domain-containing protein [Flavobacterium branchiophilum NBRC 15030 = ATCC 35035]PDS25118.1 PASTA domain-containing protein [Flavobacterium branchiophilum]TQM42244.1 PASTA domain-containing protein [Flavobacterium branchiophilum]CCB69788.1 Putative transmembrane PASTA-domain protein [Flavobacterium branchiophilum FL-15]GEM54302.1 PASTA domain-containing protein [Flavobacterium branchiophilum NBRC 15030 = ATCC 35